MEKPIINDNVYEYLINSTMIFNKITAYTSCINLPNGILFKTLETAIDYDSKIMTSVSTALQFVEGVNWDPEKKEFLEIIESIKPD